MSKVVEKQEESKLQAKGITLVPMGGVASRVRTVASMIYLAEKYHRPLEIIWHTDEEMPVSTDRLFTLVPRLATKEITLRASEGWDTLLNMPPMINNLYFSYPIVSLRYDRVLFGSHLARMISRDRDELEALLKDGEKSLLIATDQSFGNYYGMYDVLESTVEVNNVVLSIMASWKNSVVGVHINRRANSRSTFNECPIELFIKRMQEMIEADRETNFYIATTSKDERERLATIFRERVYVPHSVADPDTLKGVIQSLGELLALSHCDRILTTPESNYSQVASELGNVPLETLSIYANI